MSNYQPIVSSDENLKEGTWVFTDQERAIKEGFRNVSSIWHRQTMSFDEGMEKIAVERAERRDILCDIGDIQVHAEGDGVYFVVQGERFKPTLHAMHQYGTNCYVPHTIINNLTEPVLKPGKKGREPVVRFHRDAADYDILATIMQNGQRRVEKGKRFICRTYTNGTMRAMLTDKYATIDNEWFLRALSEILPGGRLSHFDRADADTLYGNVLIPDTIRQDVDSEYGGMVSIGNCEIGTRRFSALPSLFRAICMNGCIWGQTKGEKIHYVHKGNIQLLSLRKELQACIEQQIPLVHTRIVQFLNTRTMGTDGVAVVPLFAQLARQYALTPVEATETVSQFNLYEKGDRNLFGMVNSLTRAGQKQSAKRWAELDEVAGRIVTIGDNEWSKMKDKASRLTTEEVDAAFLTASI